MTHMLEMQQPQCLLQFQLGVTLELSPAIANMSACCVCRCLLTHRAACACTSQHERGGSKQFETGYNLVCCVSEAHSSSVLSFTHALQMAPNSDWFELPQIEFVQVKALVRRQWAEAVEIRRIEG